MRARDRSALLTTTVVVGALATGIVFGSLTGGFRSEASDGIPPLLTGALPIGFIFITLTSIGMLIAALVRRSKILDEQVEISKRQFLEIEVQRRAMDAHAMVIVTEPNGVITSVNQKFCDVWGCSEDTILGSSVSMLYPDTSNDTNFQSVHSTLQAGQIWTGETPMLTAKGERRLVHATCSPMFDESGIHIKNVSVRTDITKLRKSENAHFLKELLDNLHDEVYIFDVETLSMRYMNLRALGRCGWTESDLPNKVILDTDPNFVEPMFREHVAPLMSGEVEFVTVQTVQNKGPVEIRTRLYEGIDGQRLFISVLRDTTERAQIEKARLESVSMVSHELRTPLTSIKGALRLLKSGALGELSEQAKPVVDIADRNSERLLLIVNDILDLEKIRAGKMKFDLKPSNLVPFLEDAVSMNKGYADEHGVEIKLQTDLPEAWVKMEKDRMMQVMSNLISNAVKYSPAGDTVWIELDVQDKYLRIGVRDNGPGIPANMRASIFDSFTQLDSPDGQQRQGTGLGLAISKLIVKSHSGRINIDSNLGEGSTFLVELPSLDSRGNVVPILAGKSVA